VNSGEEGASDKGMEALHNLCSLDRHFGQFKSQASLISNGYKKTRTAPIVKSN
jgi:hypothetical protein